MFQESAMGCVKAPAVEFPQVGPMFQIWIHLRELNRGSFHAAHSRFLNHFLYKSEFSGEYFLWKVKFWDLFHHKFNTDRYPNV